MDEELRAELLAMYERASHGSMPGDDEAGRQRVGEIDRANIARIRQIIAEHGWPGHHLVGEEASNAALLLVQRADHDGEFQRRCLPVLAEAVLRRQITQVEEA